MPATSYPFIVSACFFFSSFAVVLGSVSIWAHAKDRKSR